MFMAQGAASVPAPAIPAVMACSGAMISATASHSDIRFFGKLRIVFQFKPISAQVQVL
jgi:hypothetical protein